LSWLFKNGTAPIVDMFNSASADMVDIHLCVLFRALHSSENYLRIQARYGHRSMNYSISTSKFYCCLYRLYSYMTGYLANAVRSTDGQRGLYRQLLQEEHG
jgi:hypothetical protein